MCHATQMDDARHKRERVMAYILEQWHIVIPCEACSYYLEPREWVTNTDRWDTAHIHMSHRSYFWAAKFSATPWSPFIPLKTMAMSHGAQMNEPGHTCRWVMDLIHEQQHIAEPREVREHHLEHVTAHRWMSQDTHVDESWILFVSSNI